MHRTIVLFLVAVSAQAAPIPGLFNTGIATNGALLATGAVDPHYRLRQSADLSFPGPNTIVVNDTLFPIVAGPWLANGPSSKWIAPQANQSGGNAAGDYTYRITFSLAGLDAATAVLTGRWTSDNVGADVLLNGASTGVTGDGNFGAFGPAFTISTGFVDGTNTLDFVVNNAGTTVNPTAVRVEVSGTAEALAPPGTPPSILTQPTNRTAPSGHSATFSVVAYGSRPLSYQWRFLGGPISGATNSVLALDCVSAAQSGGYSVRVTNAFGAATSVTATLTVTDTLNPGPAELTYEPPGPSSRRTPLAFSEIMYHPTNRADGRNLEFIELYNSNPFFEDISGWQLTGSFDYTFPSNTLIQANSYVVVAPVPADVEAVYALPVVFGGTTNNATNSLPNNAGTVRLRKRSGAVVLEVNYSDAPPWPVAADGTGHSLVLARPSHGENNPRAWAQSARRGGSPGAADPVPDGPLENVVINELLSHSAPPVSDYVELFNQSPVTVDLAGCALTDDPATNKFRLGNGVTIQPGGFVSFSEATLGFALSASGETIYFVSSNGTRVIDAVRFGGQALNQAFGRSPDGAPALRALATPTPGTNNAPSRTPRIVLNEIMYNPPSGRNDDEFVELHNPGAGAVNVGGWKLTGGVSFTLPAGRIIPGGGYLVIANNASWLNGQHTNLNAQILLGNYGGSLANGGERLALTEPITVVQTNATNGTLSTNVFDSVLEEVTYETGGRWGRWSDGGGSSLELVDPRSPERTAPHWADSDESGKAAWITVTNTGVLDHGHPSQGAADQLQIMLLGEGEALVDDVQVIVAGANRISNPTFESGVGGWTFQGTHRTSYPETNRGFNSARSLHLVASDRGDHVANRIRTALTSTIPANTTNVTLGAKVKWLRGNPEILLRLKGGYLEAFGRLSVPANPATPGARNSRWRANAGPALTEVTHRPVLPTASQGIRVSARVHDPDGVAHVVLRYRVDPATSLTSIPMSDDGMCDSRAGDGVYSAVIPGQPDGRLVAFHVIATDAFGQPATAQFPDDAPARECLVRVGDPAPASRFGTYRLWLTQAAVNSWAAREKMSNEDVDGTFVYGTNRVVYNAGGHYSGSSYTAPIYNSPVGNLCGYDLTFPVDDAVLGETHFTLDWPIRDNTDQREQLMFWFLDQWDLPNMYRRYVNLFVNGLPRGTIYDDVQQPGGNTVSEWFPDGDEGNLHKTDCWNEFDDAGNRIDPCILNSLENFTTTGGVKKAARYRWNWRPRAVQGTANDFTNLFALVDGMNAANGYVAAVESLVDVDHWARTFAMNDLASFWDAFGNPNAKNTFLYKPENDRWKLFCWDFDVGLGVFNDPPDAALFPALGDPAMNRFYSVPAFTRRYWCALQEALNTFFQAGPGTRINALLDAKYAAFQANGVSLAGPAGITDWITQRRNFLQTQLNTVNASFALTSNGGVDFNTGQGFVALTGTAPVSVKTIWINGVEYPVLWNSSTSWTLRLALGTGTNALTVQGYDRFGRLVSGATDTLRITVTNALARPEDSLVLNEIQYHPAVPDTEFIEVFNRSTNTAFDLTGYRLNGLDFDFPDHTVIPPTNFVVVAQNLVAFGRAYGVAPLVVGQYRGSFDQGGETISLIQRGATPAEDRVIDAVAYDDDPPWPAAADGSGQSLQLIDAAQDNTRVANWSTGSGWRPFKFTGVPGGNRLFLFMDSPGDVYLDDLVLVAGPAAGVGTNWLENGGFESPLTGPWRATGNHTNSAITTGTNHSGAGCLHVVATNAGNTVQCVYQDIPGLIITSNYTISGWLLPGTNGNGISVRFSTSFRPFFSVRPVLSTPGTNNVTGTTLPPFPPLWLNEVQPENLTGPSDGQGEREPWIEIYNAGTNALSLDGFFLADNFTNLEQWPFPPGQFIGPGEFKLVWADAEPDETAGAEWHANFRLPAGRGSVALATTNNNQRVLLDYINYDGVAPDQSFGSSPDGNPLRRGPFYYPTPARTNDNTAAPVAVWINEWMAANTGSVPDPAGGMSDDWFELYNPGTHAVSLAGFTLTDTLANPRKFTVPAGIGIAPGGFLLVWADEQSSQTQTNGDLHVNFKLSQGGEAIGLFDPVGRGIDAVTFGTQTNDLSQGRYPDGAGSFYFMTTPTPRAPNRVPGAEPITIISVTVTDGSLVTLVWTSFAGGNYRVQFKGSLAEAAWQDLPGDVPATGTTAAKSDTLREGVTRFYRVLRLP